MPKATKDEIEIIKQYIKNSNEKFLILEHFVEMVLDENRKHNLIGNNTIDNIWTRHVIDSLQLVDYIQNEEIIIDLGSGAGFPAIVLNIATNKQTILIEKSPVKAKFLQNVINTLKLNAEVKNKILTKKNFKNFAIKNSVVVSRAFKSIQEILDFISNNKNVNKIVLLKGKTWQEEIKKVNNNILNNWNYSVKQSILGEGVILEFKRKESTD